MYGKNQKNLLMAADRRRPESQPCNPSARDLATAPPAAGKPHNPHTIKRGESSHKGPDKPAQVPIARLLAI